MEDITEKNSARGYLFEGNLVVVQQGGLSVFEFPKAKPILKVPAPEYTRTVPLSAFWDLKKYPLF